MKRFLNFRLPVLLGCAYMAGIAAGYLFISYGISLIWIAAVVAVTAVIIILLTVFKKRYKLIFTLLITALFIILGLVNCYTRLDGYSKSRLVSGETYTVSASVSEKGENSRGEYVILSNAAADGVKLNGKIIAYLDESYGDFCDVGYKVNFNAKIYAMDLFQYGKINYYAQENVKYSCTVYGGLTAQHRFSLFGGIRSAIRKALYDNVDGDTAAIAYAMLTGNTQGVDDGSMASFRYGGIAHIFAVSGLHIGLIYGFLHFIFKKLGTNKYAAFALCVIPVFLYTGICGFTLSSVRAAIMCTVSASAKLTYRKYDGLNALSLAVIIILIISPVSLITVGFQLSVCSVGAIILISKNLARPFKRLPRKISGALSVSVSAQAGTAPVLLANFGYLSGAGLLLNFIILPVLSLVYLLLFISVLIAVAMPFSAFLLQYAVLPLQLVISAILNIGFEKALISGFGAGAFVPVYLIGLSALTDKINLKVLHRLAAVLCAVTVLCSYVLINTFAPFSGFKIAISAYYGSGEVIIKSNRGNILIVTEDFSASHVQNTLNEYYASNLSAIIILGDGDCLAELIDYGLKCDNVYICGNNINLQPFEGIKVNYENSFTACGVQFEFADEYSLFADLGGTDVAVCAGNYNPVESCDLLISDIAGNCESKYCIGFNERNMKNNVYNCGNFEFTVKDGNLKGNLR